MRKSIFSIAIGLAILSSPLQALAQQQPAPPVPAPGYSFPDDEQPANMNPAPYDPYRQPGAPGQPNPPIPQYTPPGQVPQYAPGQVPQYAPGYAPGQAPQYAPPGQVNPALPQYQTGQPYGPAPQYQPGQTYPAAPQYPATQAYPQYQTQPQTYYDPRYPNDQPDPNVPQSYQPGPSSPAQAPGDDAAYRDQDPSARALRQLRKVRRDLQQAGPDQTGHRAQAQQYLDQAIQELRAASPAVPRQ